MKLTEIYLYSSICYRTNLPFDTVLRILEDPFLKGDGYIQIHLDDGCKAALRKQDVISVNEFEEYEKA